METLKQKSLTGMAFAAEHARVNTTGKVIPTEVNPVSRDQWLQDCEYMGDILDIEILKKLLRTLENKFGDFKAEWPANTAMELSAVPCDDMGDSFSSVQIQNGSYLQLFFRAPDGLTYSQFSYKPGNWADLTPVEMQRNCTADIKYTDTSEQISTSDFQNIYNNIIDQFNALREFFGLERLDLENLKYPKAA